jgi:hypothetical protein
LLPNEVSAYFFVSIFPKEFKNALDMNAGSLSLCGINSFSDNPHWICIILWELFAQAEILMFQIQ